MMAPLAMSLLPLLLLPISLPLSIAAFSTPTPFFQNTRISHYTSRSSSRRVLPFISRLAAEVTESEDESPPIVFAEDPYQVKDPILSEGDTLMIDQISKRAGIAGGDPTFLEALVMEVLPDMSPSLVVALRKAAVDDTASKKMNKLGVVLENILNTRLQSGRDTLGVFLKSGEIRKLDGAIGTAARAGDLGVAYFTVLNMNIKDAYLASSQDDTDDTTVGIMEETDNIDDEKPSSPAKQRLQILQHIYTRCQEELEKIADPAVALLNKLLRTDVPSIRSNQLSHYLGPPTDSITTPDGKEISIPKGGKALVLPRDFLTAVQDSVMKIRQIEAAGGTNRMTAANAVESCRQVAIEARLVISEEYGEGSEELELFQEKLQTVFRPGTNL